MILYVIEQGAVLTKEAGKIAVKKEGRNIGETPIKNIEKINILGNIGLTTPLISYLLENNIEVTFMTEYGRYRGRLYKDEYKNIKLRLKQYERFYEEKFRIKTAKLIVEGKLKNSYDFIEKKSRERLKGEMGKSLAGIRKAIESLEKSETIEQLRGFEGIGSRFYFEGFKKVIKNEKFYFERREPHPPKDMMNSLLSLGYTFLYNEVLGAMNSVGLDPYFGNLHEPEMGKRALLFDMVEEYRAVIVDEFILKAVNRNEINESDFEKDEEGILKMTREGMGKFIEKYENSMKNKYINHIDGEENYIRTIFEKQSRMYARYVTGEEEIYTPFRLSGKG